MSYAAAKLIQKTVGLRVNAAEEEEGLDMAMHGIPAYNELERFSDQPGLDEALLLRTGSED
ncbi:hypothetical protein D3C74_456770 [compost metagenome]